MTISGCLQSAYADPTIVSPLPANGASPSGPFVFVFSEPMDTDFTEVAFTDITDPFNTLPTINVWSGGNTVLTCTPSPAFAANRLIVWSAFGQNPNGDFLADPTGGFFTTGGGGGGSSGTNAITEFSVGKSHHYNQTSTALPVLDPSTPYGLSAVTSLSSNRSATNVTLTLPGSAVSNLVQNFFAPELFTMFASYTSLSTFDATFPAGNYTFTVKAVTSNQMVVVNFPGSITQPGAPHVSNYSAAQAVNPGQAFALTWDAFPGGTSSDYIFVSIGNAYNSPNPGLPGALSGTATAFNIPANTLQAGSSYDSTIGFYHAINITNGTSYITTVYRATFTDFMLTTTTSSSSLKLTNAIYSPANFSFDVLSPASPSVIVEYKTNLSSVVWHTLLVTNNPPSRFHAVAPQSTTNRHLFFRARIGP